MGGFFSDSTRDVIALIGLVLAILQTALAFKALNTATGGTKDSLSSDQARKPLITLLLECLSSPSGQQIRAMLARLIGCLCAVGATTWLLTYIIPLPADPAPASLIQVIVAMAGMVSAVAVPIYCCFFVGAIEEWLGKNDASKTQISNLEAFSLSLAAGLLSLCVLTLWFGDANGWVSKFSFFQIAGIGFLVMLFLSGVIEQPGGIKQFFEEIMCEEWGQF